MKRVFYFLFISFIVIGTQSVRAQTTDDADSTQTEVHVEPAKKRNIFSWFTDFFANRKKSLEAPSKSSALNMQKFGRDFSKMELEELNYHFIEYSIEGNYDALVQLLKYGASINAANVQGRTALIEAARLGNYKVAKWLIERGANISYKDMYDGNALIYATKSGKNDIVRLLLENGARKEISQ